MKLTKTQLKRIIKEELLKEFAFGKGYVMPAGKANIIRKTIQSCHEGDEPRPDPIKYMMSMNGREGGYTLADPEETAAPGAQERWPSAIAMLRDLIKTSEKFNARAFGPGGLFDKCRAAAGI